LFTFSLKHGDAIGVYDELVQLRTAAGDDVGVGVALFYKVGSITRMLASLSTITSAFFLSSVLSVQGRFGPITCLASATQTLLCIPFFHALPG
jgi:hypothetical protein